MQPRNHATLVLQWNGKMLYFDPVPTATYTGLPKADLILITHTHSDHLTRRRLMLYAARFAPSLRPSGVQWTERHPKSHRYCPDEQCLG